MSDVCGPWTLDQLDAFGTVDSIEITFDSPIWQSSDTCIRTSSADVTGLASLIGSADRIRFSTASITGVGLVTGEAIRTRLSAADITGNATISANGIRVRLSAASITGVANTSGFGGIVADAHASVTGVATVEALAFAIYDASGSVLGFALTEADGSILGSEWTKLEPGSEVWQFRGTGICGPFTLDQLDIFGGVDELPFSLDNPIYLREDFCANVELWDKKDEGTNTWLRKG